MTTNEQTVKVLVVGPGSRNAGQMDWGLGLSSAVESRVRSFKRVGAGGQDCKCVSLQSWLAFFTPLSHGGGL